MDKLYSFAHIQAMYLYNEPKSTTVKTYLLLKVCEIYRINSDNNYSRGQTNQ